MRLPVAKQSATGRPRQLTAERAINFYPEQAPQDAKSPIAMLGTPGMETWATTAVGPLQAGVNWLGTLYAVAGGHLYSFDSAGRATDYGDTGFIGEVHIAASGDQLVICDGGFGYLDGFFVYGGSVTTGYVFDRENGLQRITDDAFASFGESAFFISAVGDASEIDALDFASAEALPDKITTLKVDHREVWVFGRDSVEIWHNTGGDFPLSRLQGATIEKYGCISPQTVQSFDNQIVYLDTFGIVRIAARGMSPKRISTHAIESAISQSLKFEEAYALVYIEEGHEFYALTVPDVGTYVYDAATQIWHERRSPGLETWRPRFYIEAYGQKLIGDATDGRLWRMSLDLHAEDDQPLIATVINPPIQADGRRFTLNEIQFDFEVGVAPAGLNPHAMLEMSSDGRTWRSLEAWRSLGESGQYRQRVMWRRLGQHRVLHTRVSISSPVKRAYYATYARLKADG